MNNSEQFKLPPEQLAIRAKCFHPSGRFVEFPKEDVEQSIPARFEKIVCKYADRVAIKSGNQILTYTELNSQANRLAHTIVREQGDKAEPVALLLETGPALMAATLGVLKAGKFVVLLDPSFPESRNAAILEDSQAQVVISNRQNAPVISRIADRDCQLIELESVNPKISAENLGLSIAPEALAFLVYTSGSTGQPKGVMQDHRSRLHQFMWSTNTYHICMHDRSSLLMSGTSSALVVSLRTLLNGATLLPFDVRREGVSSLASWLLLERISVCVISSPLFRSFCETLTGDEGFPDLRLIRLSSETAFKSDFDLYKKYFATNCILTNGLSPTEAGALTDYFMDQDTEISGNEIPVGYPLADVEILLLDDESNRRGPNRVGEMAVKSRYLSSGYWRRPDLTAAKFRPDPEGTDARVYLTGDLGLMLPGGCLFHKGRKDSRVKIRGYGVETAEVEVVLRDYRGVNDAIVLAHQNKSGEARLVAYFTSPLRPGPSGNELRAFLKEKLPDCMIPSAFMLLDAVPLTPSGKLDREALPDPKNSRSDLTTPPLAPRTLREKKLVKIWAKELNIDQVGVHDNFFDLGGDSLLAMRVISRIRDELQVELSLSKFFETPTAAALACYLETLHSPRDRAGMFSIRPASRNRELLPSFAQQSLWFIDQLEPGSPAYSLFSATELRGPLDVLLLERSFNELIGRHESLRTVFNWVNGQPLQIILPALTIVLPVVDLRDIVSPTEREAEIRRLSTAEARRPFDLERGPLLRVTLLRMTEDTYVLFMTVHHIIFDGRSREVLVRELSTVYEAFSSGRPALLPALSIQYADFAQWQRRRLRDKALEEKLASWKKQLENISILKLPSDRPRPAVRTFKGARQSFTVGEELVAGLNILARQEGVTFFMTLLAAYLTLLHRYTGQNDIGIGSPMSGRNRSELESLIGLFLNMLVLRTDLSGNPTFRELLSRVRKVCLEAYANQDVPFEKLVRELRPQRSLGHNPLFQVTFALQNGPTCLPKLAGVTAEDLDLGSGIASFDLHLFMIEDETTLSGWLIYNTDLFDADTITRMTGHFHRLLEAIVAQPDQRISELPMLTEGEQHQLLVEWNDTKRDYPRDKHIHERFEDQVGRTPEAIAVVYEDKQLTYRELNNRSNQLARYLQKRGVGPEILVGLCVERSVEMIVGLLGILKAGGVYMPLDPGYPKERLVFMLNDSQAAVLLTQERLLDNVVEDRGLKPVLSEIEGIENSDSQSSILDPRLKAVCLERDWREIAQETKENLSSGATANNLAYVIYTSGSTGSPKGVMITHRGISNRLLWAQDVYQLTSADRVLQKAPFGFDVSVWEFFWPLLLGARLIIARPQGHRDADYLVRLIAEQEITTVHFVPSMLRIFLEERGVDTCKCLKRITCGGETLSLELQERFFSKLDAELHNLYGPTEASIDVTWWACKRGSGQRVVPIGRPIANTQIYVLDSHLQPVPIGVAGELYIAGVSLARGYLNRADLTAEKFIPHPFSNEPGARLYKTGDLARYLPDGAIEFLGRADNQVKIRGYRIELGEIESALGEHHLVRHATVLAREDGRGDKKLVAYVVPQEFSAPTTSELTAFLKQKLPQQMIPSAFLLLDALPLMANGKIDRRALPAPNQSRPELEQSYQAPRTPVEQAVAEIWAEVLKVKEIGVHDNFFDLGGHSLLATQVISRVRGGFQVNMPLRTLFEMPTIAELSNAILTQQAVTLNNTEVAGILTEIEESVEKEAELEISE